MYAYASCDGHIVPLLPTKPLESAPSSPRIPSRFTPLAPMSKQIGGVASQGSAWPH